MHPFVLRSFRPARFRGQDPLTQTIISPALWYFLPVWNMRLTLPRGFLRDRIQFCQRTIPDTCMQALFTLLQASCLRPGPGMCDLSIWQPTIPQRPSHDLLHHTSTWGGAHPGGAVIKSILRVRLCRGLASRREPESHGTQMGITHKDLRRRGKPCC